MTTVQAPFTTSPRHPVRWFVGVPVCLAALLLLAWWAGLAAPRLTVTATVLSLDPSGETVLDVRNDGRLAVEIVAATPIGEEVTGVALVAPLRVPGTERADARLRVAIGCQSTSRGPSGVRLHVRTWLGVDRHVDVTDAFLDRCGRAAS
jgi:hypothetical protein